jgi:hypothetical protein
MSVLRCLLFFLSWTQVKLFSLHPRCDIFFLKLFGTTLDAYCNLEIESLRNKQRNTKRWMKLEMKRLEIEKYLRHNGNY